MSKARGQLVRILSLLGLPKAQSAPVGPAGVDCPPAPLCGALRGKEPNGDRHSDSLALMDDNALFAQWFRGDSWRAWRVLLKAVFCLPLDDEELKILCAATGRPQQFCRD